jgi:thiamine pyrophosphate-dependent acetolactate synthase large subunit-like protein
MLDMYNRAMPTLSEFLAQKLSEAKVDVVFGLPGGENVEVLDALRERGIDFVLVRNESSAVFMADAHARLTGGIGVALATLGPGAANAYAGIAHAYLDRSPVLLITAQNDPKMIGKHTHQVMDLQAVFRPVTKFTAAALSRFCKCHDRIRPCIDEIGQSGSCPFESRGGVGESTSGFCPTPNLLPGGENGE